MFFLDLIVRICVVCMLTCKKYVNLIKISVDNMWFFFYYHTWTWCLYNKLILYSLCLQNTKKLRADRSHCTKFFSLKKKTLFNSVILSSNLQNFLQISTIFESVKWLCFKDVSNIFVLKLLYIHTAGMLTKEIWNRWSGV